MKLSQFRSLIREEIKNVLKEDYLKSNNLYISEFRKLSPEDYATLVKLIQQFDKMQETNDKLFDFTSEYIDSETFSDSAGYELFYSSVAKKAAGKFPKAAAVAGEITKILQKLV